MRTLRSTVVAVPRRLAVAAVFTAAAVVGVAVVTAAGELTSAPALVVAAPAPLNLASAFQRVPLAFTTAGGDALAAHGPGYGFLFTREGVRMAAAASPGKAVQVGLIFRAHRRGAQPLGRRLSSARVTGFAGSASGVTSAAYGRVVYTNEWPGVDIVFTGNGRALRYTATIQPGASVSEIRMSYSGGALALDQRGDLELATPAGTVHDLHPSAYQVINGVRRPVASRFVREGAHAGFGFALGSYDPSLPVVIDPTLVYSTLLGGRKSDGIWSTAVDSSGQAYAAGYTMSPDFPVTAGKFVTTVYGEFTFVAKFDPTGSRLVYSAEVGGNGFNWPADIAVGDDGSAYVVGMTSSTDFPTTAGSYQPRGYGDTNDDGFIFKLAPGGSRLEYSSYIATAEEDDAHSVAVDQTGAAYVGGTTESPLFHTTPGLEPCNQTGNGEDGYVLKLNPAGTGADWSTCIGGAGEDYLESVALDSSGDVYIGGGADGRDFPTTAGAYQTASANNKGDAFVAKLDPAGHVVYSTLIGGASGGDYAEDVLPLPDGTVYAVGVTFSSDYPTTPGVFEPTMAPGDYDDAFVTRLNATGTGLVSSTLLGGWGADAPRGIAVARSGDIFVVGETTSSDFPTTPDALDREYQGKGDGFMSELDEAGDLLYSSYWGTSGADYAFGAAVDPEGVVYVGGDPVGSSFRTTQGARAVQSGGGHDGYLSAFTTTCTITGTAGNDVLQGTPHRDVICGEGGDDRIYGLGGNDIIIGGSGNDVISGGPGNDVIIAGSGDDVVAGSTGNDLILGGGGNDRLFGGPGDDTIFGNAGTDLLSGSYGDDRLNGGAGNDRLDGGSGNDRLLGAGGNDVLTGDQGADYLDGGSGRNHCPDSIGPTVRRFCTA